MRKGALIFNASSRFLVKVKLEIDPDKPKKQNDMILIKMIYTVTQTLFWLDNNALLIKRYRHLTEADKA